MLNTDVPESGLFKKVRFEAKVRWLGKLTWNLKYWRFGSDVFSFHLGVFLGLKWWFSRVYTAYILHLAFFGVEFWNIREYTKKQSNNLNKCHGKESQRIFECMFFSCQTLTDVNLSKEELPKHLPFWTQEILPLVEKLGAFFWLWKKLCIIATIWRCTCFYWNHDLWEVSGTVPKAAIGKQVSFCKTAKNFHSHRVFFFKNTFLSYVFFLFGARTSPIHQVVLLPKSPVGGTKQLFWWIIASPSFKGAVLSALKINDWKPKSWKVWKHDVPFETGWFSGSKCQFSKGTSGNLPCFLGGGDENLS